jgi:hypothetical protein
VGLRLELDHAQSTVDQGVPAHPRRWLSRLAFSPSFRLRRESFGGSPSRVVRRGRPASVGAGVLRSRSRSFPLQAALLSSCVNVPEAGPVRSTGITRLRHYYEPRRLPNEAARPVMDSRPASSSSVPSWRRAN